MQDSSTNKQIDIMRMEAGLNNKTTDTNLYAEDIYVTLKT